MVSVRAVMVEGMIFLVHCAYQPGGTAEKAYLLQFLTAPDSGTTLDAVPDFDKEVAATLPKRT